MNFEMFLHPLMMRARSRLKRISLHNLEDMLVHIMHHMKMRVQKFFEVILRLVLITNVNVKSFDDEWEHMKPSFFLVDIMDMLVGLAMMNILENGKKLEVIHVLAA